MNSLVKFGFCGAVILGGILWLAIEAQSGDGSLYYVKVEEIDDLGASAYQRRLKVAGKVAAGSRRHEGDLLHFSIEGEKGGQLPTQFAYQTEGVLPDNFEDGAMVIVEGILHSSSPRYLEAKKIQTKCSSKYEADYDQKRSEYEASQTARRPER